MVMSPVEQLTNAATAARAHRRNRSVSITEAPDGRIELHEAPEMHDRSPPRAPVEVLAISPEDASASFAGRFVPMDRDRDYRGDRTLGRLETIDQSETELALPQPPMSAALEAFAPVDPQRDDLGLYAVLAVDAGSDTGSEAYDAERAAAASREAEREAERRESVRLEAERLKAERLERERAEKARHEAERVERERALSARSEAERASAAERVVALRDQLRTGKTDGGIMLRGVSTMCQL
jgi:hypothetical protein